MATDSPPVQPQAPRRVELVVVGASAGGVAALLALLGPLPASYPLPVVAVLHLLPRHESRLGRVLAHRLALPAREARDKEAIAAGTVYLASPDYHLLIETDRSFSFSSEPPVSFARPSIDVLMSSAADAYGAALAGVLLTGANMDAGGLTIVQQPAEADVPTMPQAAIARCRPDHILPLQDIQRMLARLAHSGEPA
jgi:two-component system, chemotaxis family, protein-glutamate methylesterase/glutaminase